MKTNITYSSNEDINLTILKDLLNITDTSKDNILNHYLTRAETAIQSYLNYSDEDMADAKVRYSAEIIDLAIFWYKNKDKTGTIQMSQGSRSMTLERGIPQSIKDSLPLPRLKVIG